MNQIVRQLSITELIVIARTLKEKNLLVLSTGYDILIFHVHIEKLKGKERKTAIKHTMKQKTISET